MWHQPCNKQTVLQVHYFGGYSKTRYRKLVSPIKTHESAVNLLESEEYGYGEAKNRSFSLSDAYLSPCRVPASVAGREPCYRSSSMLLYVTGNHKDY